MRRISTLIILLLPLLVSAITNSDNISIPTAYNDSSMSDTDIRFQNWTEEMYRAYNDSIVNALYPRPQIVVGDTLSMSVNPGKQKVIGAGTNTHVPTSVDVYQFNAVGEIKIYSGTSQTGAKTYEVPISSYPGVNGFSPDISMSYNSQQPKSNIGVGWRISGLSEIKRAGVDIYYDGHTRGIEMSNNDSFLLDGMRLIKTDTSSGYIQYESEQGNIKAKGYFVGNILKYFEVFYPDGRKGIFGTTGNSTNQLTYPLTKLSDMFGNQIDYTYVDNGGDMNISLISYNGASIEFQYKDTEKADHLLKFSGGKEINNNKLLSTISCKFGSTVLCNYILSHSKSDYNIQLHQIDYESGGRRLNPLRFYYGEGSISSSFEKKTTQLMEWYSFKDISSVRVSKGKFDYFSGNDGMIVLPNSTPYFHEYEHATTFRHSKNVIVNTYGNNDKIFLYTQLTDNYVNPVANLTTEAGFIDIFAADLVGCQEEYVIKVNNYVENGKDKVMFNVYKPSLSGLPKLYTRTFYFPTVYKDHRDNESITPKNYYTGDFDGDGRIEILAVSFHNPIGDTTKPSKCYLFDLVNNTILFQGHIFPYCEEMVGTRQPSGQDAANNSDKLIMLDYDGDGKTDICHIGDSGLSVYTFNTSGSAITAQKITSSSILKKADLKNRDLLTGDFNGDGLADLLVPPLKALSNNDNWTIYNSKGNGAFKATNFTSEFS